MKNIGDKIPKVAVIIPNFNGEAFLGQCLDSLSNQSEKDFETILVDNGSTDRSIGIAEKHPLKVRLVKLATNLGFAGAVNAGIDHAGSDLIALLNNDAVADSKWVENILSCAEQTKTADFFASLVLQYDDRSKIESAGVAYSLQARSKPLFENETAANQKLKIEPFLASGTAVAIRKSLVQKIGKFDADYFAYLEDLDFFLRARLAGSIGALCPGAIVYHRGAATELGDRPGPRRMESSRRVYLIARNRWHLIWDNLPAGVIILLCPLIFSGWLRGLGYHLFKSGQIGSFLAGSFNGFFSLPSRLSKRSAAKKLRRLKTTELLSWMKKGLRELL